MIEREAYILFPTQTNKPQSCEGVLYTLNMQNAQRHNSIALHTKPFCNPPHPRTQSTTVNCTRFRTRCYF
jgi:hypothetical protein